MLMNVQDRGSAYPSANAVNSGKKSERVQDILSKRYSNAEIFVADRSKIGAVGYSQDYRSDKEYSIILDEDEMNLLASTDPKDKKAQEKLYAQIDTAMKDAEKLGEDVAAKVDPEKVWQVGVSVGNDGKSFYFANTENGGFQMDSKESLMDTLLEKIGLAKAEA